MKALHNLNGKLTLADGMEEPTRGRGEVKVQVHYASLNPTDIDIARGDLDLFFRLYRVQSSVRTGLEFSGTVLEGSDRFRAGAKVFGYTHLMKGPKTHQDVISIPEQYVAEMPGAMSFAQAAAFPLGAQTSLVALRDVARLKSGQSVLILGASGGLGVYAIQLARSMQVSVTGVSGPDGLDTMSEFGANAIIDYRQTSLAEIKGTFDAVLDLSTRYRFRDIRPLLNRDGIFVPADPLKSLWTLLGNPFRRTKVGYLYVDHGDSALLADLAGKVADGSLRVGPYQAFDFQDFETAIASLNEPGRIGRTVLRLR